MVITLAGVLVIGGAIAKESTQMSILEKKLYQAAKKEGKVVWWDSQSMKDSVKFIKAFNNRYPDIELVVYETNPDDSDSKYFLEHKSGRVTADVLQTAWYLKFKEEGLLTSLRDIIEDTGYPKEYHPDTYDAVGLAFTVKGAAYNSNLVSEKDVPQSWDDLLDPKWKGKIAINPDMEIFVYQTWTWGEEKIIDYLKKLKEQNPMFMTGVTKTMTLLGAGEFPLATGASLGVVLKLQQAGKLPIAFAPINPAVCQFPPNLIVRDSPHPNAAKLLLRWLMTPEGISLMDKIRKKGNPLPGYGTAQSRALEQMGMKVSIVPAWGEDIKGITDRYLKAIDFRKDKLKKK
jgi:iron(III) transport system substrate-binding protein